MILMDLRLWSAKLVVSVRLTVSSPLEVFTVTNPGYS